MYRLLCHANTPWNTRTVESLYVVVVVVVVCLSLHKNPLATHMCHGTELSSTHRTTLSLSLSLSLATHGTHTHTDIHRLFVSDLGSRHPPDRGSCRVWFISQRWPMPSTKPFNPHIGLERSALATRRALFAVSPRSFEERKRDFSVLLAANTFAKARPPLSPMRLPARLCGAQCSQGK